MKRVLLIFIFIVPLVVQAQLTDNFSDGDFTNNPTWVGDGSQFTVNSSFQLQLNNTAAGQSYLAVPANLASLDTTEWSCWVHFAFAPSSSNYGRVYLVSDQSNLEGPLNGYYLQFGESLSNDAIELFRQSGTTSSSVCRGTSAEIAAAFTVGVKVTRDENGVWSLYVDAFGGTNYAFEASGTDLTFTTSAFSGVSCVYTISNASGFYFDDFSIRPMVPDIIPPVIDELTVIDSVHLDVKYSEAVEQVSAETLLNYEVNNSIGNPSSAQRDAANISLVHLTFTTPFAEGLQNTLSIFNVADPSGNIIASGTNGQFTWYKPLSPDSGDVIINEVLFHAQSGGKEFVEIYNRSSKALDLKDIFLYDPAASNPLYTITSATHLFLPGDYAAITRDVSDISSRYVILNPSALIQVASMPTYTDAGDVVAVATSSGQILDRLDYLESWQFPLLNDPAGVSLERLNPSRPTQDQSNWHSASESAGFATPGYKNSQSDDSQNNGSEISVDPEIFSPDNDGHNDVVNLHFHFSNPGNVANVNVYDSKGRLVRNLVNNILVGNDGSFVWDGVNNQNEKARIGMYVFYIEVFDINGDSKHYKKTCVLASKL